MPVPTMTGTQGIKLNLVQNTIRGKSKETKSTRKLVLLLVIALLILYFVWPQFAYQKY